MSQHRTVASAGLDLAVWETSRPVGADRPTIVFVHGFPDTHAVWDPVVSQLEERFHCVVYDVRGAGRSGAPEDPDGYVMPHLVSDLVAVLEAVAPERPVHLIGHDWGSVQAWDAVSRERFDPRLKGRISTYTTISGPCLDHVLAFARAARRGGWRRRKEGLEQLLHSWYVYAFLIPKVPDHLLRRHGRWLLETGQRGHVHFGPTLPHDAARGLNLYRANVLRHTRVPGGATTTIPVQLVVPLRDRYVLPQLTRDLHRFAPDLTRVEMDAGHWVLQSHPDEIARLVASFVDSHPGAEGPF